MKKSGFIFIALGIIAMSCEKIIDINVPEGERKIVLNSLLNPDDPFSAEISRSKSILEDDFMAPITDATVKVFEGSDLIGIMDYKDYGRYVLESSYPSNGKEYRLVVEHGDLDPVFSEVLIPPSVPIIEIDTSRSKDEYGNAVYKLNVDIDDPGNVDNYYALSIRITERIFDWENETYLDTTQSYNSYLNLSSIGGNNIGEDLIESGPAFSMDEKLFFHDAPLLGSDGKLELGLEYYIFSFLPDSIEVEFRLDHIDQSYYKYALSKNRYYRTNESPFAEPVKVFNNVEDGFGILGAFSRSRHKFKLFPEGGR